MAGSHARAADPEAGRYNPRESSGVWHPPSAAGGSYRKLAMSGKLAPLLALVPVAGYGLSRVFC